MPEKPYCTCLSTLGDPTFLGLKTVGQREYMLWCHSTAWAPCHSAQPILHPLALNLPQWGSGAAVLKRTVGCLHPKIPNVHSSTCKKPSEMQNPVKTRNVNLLNFRGGIYLLVSALALRVSYYHCTVLLMVTTSRKLFSVPLPLLK